MSFGCPACLKYSVSCSKILESIPNTFISLNRIHDVIRMRHFMIIPSLYKFFGLNDEDALVNFAEVIREGKMEFEEYMPLVMKASLTNMESSTWYEFKDNFMQAVDGFIPVTDIEIPPLAIISLGYGNGMGTDILTADKWKYINHSYSLYSVIGNCDVKYTARYPYRAKLADDKKTFSATSGIYLIDNSRFDALIDQLSLSACRRIQNYFNLVQLPGFTSNLQIDQLVNKLEEKVQKNRARSRDMYHKWRVL